jgi:predicted MFS family arabinose efflux permease
MLLSLMFVAGVPAFVATGRLAESLPEVPLLTTVVWMFVAGVLLLTVVDGLFAIAVASVVIGYAFFSIIPTIDTYLLTSLPDDQRGSAYSIYSFSMMIVQALGSGTIGLAVVAGASYTDVFRVLAVTVGSVALVLYLLSHDR